MVSTSSQVESKQAAIVLRDVRKHYGSVHAVDGVDLEIAPGQIFGLIGHNGAGKSTLFKMMLGLERPSTGTLLVAGADVSGRDFRAARRKLGYLPENVVLYDNLSGLETLQFFARLKGAPLTQCQPLLERVGLTHAGKRAVREYSKGMRQRLGFAQALLGQPQVLFLDEPTNGLDPQAIRDFYATLRQLQQTGVTVVITSHILSELQERVDNLAILAAGKLQAQGSVQELRERTGLPLVVEIDLHGGGDNEEQRRSVQKALEAALPNLQNSQSQLEITSKGVRLECQREQKMVVLSAIADKGAVDVRLIEPSLEDMFFGFSA